MKMIMADMAPAELLAAADANLVAFWSAYGRGEGCTLHATANLVWFYTGVPFPLFNGVVLAQLAADDVRAAVDSLQAQIRQHGAPAMWWVGPRSQPAGLGSRLEGCGLHEAGELPGMALDLDRMAGQVDLPAGFTIEKVTTREQQAAWARTAGVGTGFSSAAVKGLVRLETSLPQAYDPAQPRYLGLLDGLPVATSALTLHAGLAGIYAVATVPEARGRGIGRAMTAAPLLEARQQGYGIGILQASEMGEPLYRKMGFQDICWYRLYLQSA